MICPSSVLLIPFVLLLVCCSPRNLQTYDAAGEANGQFPGGSGVGGLSYYAKDFFGEDYEVEWNAGKSHALVKKSLPVRREGVKPTLHLLIYEVESDTVIFRDAVPAGTAIWSGNGLLLVRSTPGMIRGDETSARRNGYTYQVDQRRKRQITNQP